MTNIEISLPYSLTFLIRFKKLIQLLILENRVTVSINIVKIKLINGDGFSTFLHLLAKVFLYFQAFAMLFVNKIFKQCPSSHRQRKYLGTKNIIKNGYYSQKSACVESTNSESTLINARKLKIFRTTQI